MSLLPGPGSSQQQLGAVHSLDVGCLGQGHWCILGTLGAPTWVESKPCALPPLLTVGCPRAALLPQWVGGQAAVVCPWGCRS